MDSTVKEDLSWIEEAENAETEAGVVLVNENRRTILPGEQVFLNYRYRSNEALLLYFAFCIASNPYNSLVVNLRLDPLFADDEPALEEAMTSIVDPLNSESDQQAIRLKKDQVCPVMLAFCRLLLAKGTQSSSLFKPKQTGDAVGVQNELKILQTY